MKTYRSARMQKLLKEKPAEARRVIAKAIKAWEVSKKRWSIGIKNTEDKLVATR